MTVISTKYSKILIVLLLVFTVEMGVAQPAKPPPAKSPPPPPSIYGALLPEGAVRLQKIAGSASFKVPNEIRQLEKFYRDQFVSFKDVAISERTVGDARMVVFEDRGQRPWSTIQISGIAGDKASFLMVCNDHPAQIDPFP